MNFWAPGFRQAQLLPFQPFEGPELENIEAHSLSSLSISFSLFLSLSFKQIFKKKIQRGLSLQKSLKRLLSQLTLCVGVFAHVSIIPFLYLTDVYVSVVYFLTEKVIQLFSLRFQTCLTLFPL